MDDKKYVFGFDFGTLSCRVVVIDLSNGKLMASAEKEYPHGVINGSLYHKPIILGNDWFLQDPEDWILAMSDVSKKVLRESGIHPEQVKGIGTDFTSCTLVPVAYDGSPLCLDKNYRDIPNAWPRLWKHHGAQKYAEEIEKYAKANTTWLKDYFGNSVSSEWVFPKILQAARENPEVYKKTDLFMEAVDWIVMELCGRNTRCSATLGVNSFWIKGKGYPDKTFCKALDPLMENVVETKLRGDIVVVGEAVGTLSQKMAECLGLTADTIVAAGHSDGAVTGCGAGVVVSGSMMLVMGTSTCHQMMYENYNAFDGICSIAGDGMVPGLYGYESGQPATGDIFRWFADNCTPASYVEESKKKGISVLEELGDKASRLEPGESGLVALDWFNGNRSILSNYNLSGGIIGLTLMSKPEEIYRSLVEANLFGSRRIIENYTEHRMKIDSIYAVGGLARKSPFVMQLCADILGRDIIVPMFDNVSARGSVVCAAVAVGKEKGGCASFQEAAEKLTPKERFTYKPIERNVKVYDELYRFYLELHDYFGKEDHFMRGLKTLQGFAKSCKTKNNNGE